MHQRWGERFRPKGNKRISRVRTNSNFLSFLPSGMMLRLQRAGRPAECRVSDLWWGTVHTTGSSTVTWRAHCPVSVNLPPSLQEPVKKPPLQRPEVFPLNTTLDMDTLCNHKTATFNGKTFSVKGPVKNMFYKRLKVQSGEQRTCLTADIFTTKSRTSLYKTDHTHKFRQNYRYMYNVYSKELYI